jgi:hypothetical protein
MGIFKEGIVHDGSDSSREVHFESMVSKDELAGRCFRQQNAGLSRSGQLVTRADRRSV